MLKDASDAFVKAHSRQVRHVGHGERLQPYRLALKRDRMNLHKAFKPPRGDLGAGCGRIAQATIVGRV